MPDSAAQRDPSVSRPTVLAVLLAAVGGSLIWVSQHTHRWAPPPVPQQRAAASTRGIGDSLAWPARLPHAPYLRAVARSAATGTLRGTAPLDRSMPVAVRIPAIGVDARIIPLGLGYDRTAEVPPLSTPMLASWYDLEAAPGQPGPAVLAGHVDSAATGPAVFYRLGDLRSGNLVYVTRKDRRTAVFQVDRVGLYPEWDFPSSLVYGGTVRPVLRLITCGGQFDGKRHVYLDRTVVFASYLGQQ